MVLLSSVLLDENIEKNPTGVEGISIICYGLLVGPIHPLILLKSRMDFQSGTLTFEELYKTFLCIQLPLLDDGVNIYILQKTDLEQAVELP